MKTTLKLCCALLSFIPAAAGPATAQATLEASSSSTGQNSSPALEQHNARYEIRSQDVLSISFPLTPELDQTLTVEPDGYISLQNAAAIHVLGMTVPEVTNALHQAYSGILHDPIIHVSVKDFQKPFFSVLGQVVKPGQYEFRSEITASEAIAMAGGLSQTAKSQVFVYRRAQSGWSEVKRINLANLAKGRLPREDSFIRPGDLIYVPDTAFGSFKKYVPYSVNAGTYLTPNPF